MRELFNFLSDDNRIKALLLVLILGGLLSLIGLGMICLTVIRIAA